jgi:acyl-coenzyme A synthetase/AMP-(fatty) acid ligase
VINEYPAVYESAVVGVPSELTEDEIKAVVVARDGRERGVGPGVRDREAAGIVLRRGTAR